MTCAELIKEAAKIIYVIHDEVKDKEFELELSWVGEHTGGRHQVVPKVRLRRTAARTGYVYQLRHMDWRCQSKKGKCIPTKTLVENGT